MNSVPRPGRRARLLLKRTCALAPLSCKAAPTTTPQPSRGAESVNDTLMRMQQRWGNQHVARMLDAGQGNALARRLLRAAGQRAGGLAVDRLCEECEKKQLHRSIGDGHDLASARFAGDPVLEACFDNERVLRDGSRGSAVSKVQQALVDAGFPLPVFGVDGIFGSETRTAVRDFQRSAGIGIDGIVGPQTMGALDARFSGGPAPVPPGPTPVPPGPTPVPPGPTPVPPAPAATITSQTVVTQPADRTRTTVGVGERVDLTHSAGSAAWTATAGTLSAASGPAVQWRAPDTAQTVTIQAGTATLNFTVLAPTSVVMDRQPGTGVKHTLNQPDSGIQTRVFLGPDTVNFSEARYRELDVAGVPTPGVYSCNTFSTGHCGVGAGSPCPDKALSTTVTAGKGTLSVLGDCAYSGHCGTAPPFAAGSITVTIPYEYRVGTGAFRNFSTVVQVHSLGADGSTLTSSKAGANGTTTVTSPTVVIPQCP